MKNFLKTLFTYFIIIAYFEFSYKWLALGVGLSFNVIYTALFSFVYALFFTIVLGILPKKYSRGVGIGIIALITLLFIAEGMFFYVIGTTFSMYSLNMANQAFEFIGIFLRSLFEKWFMVIWFLLPLIIYIIFSKKIQFHISVKESYKYAILYIVIYVSCLISLNIGKNEVYSPYNLYFNLHVPTVTVNNLGLMTEFRLDLARYVFGFNPKITASFFESNHTEDKEYGYNSLELDFDAVDSQVSNYLKNRSISNKNEYTGIFEGKNLIYILAEGFNTIAVNEELTPTLYKLINRGFVFENYYSPMFMSTTGGEFQYSLSLIPTQKSLNAWKQEKARFPYAIGNVFNDMGYDTFAFHDWTYTFYKRHKTMPLEGFDNYTACGNGLKVDCSIWPPSDIEMMNATIDEYIDKDKFAVHYITVSGHADYTFNDNMMSYKNRAFVENLPYSNGAKAYLAAQIELDRALSVLLDKLEEKGKLEDTVIVLSGDHYPYTLALDQINELSDYERDLTFEVNNSNLVIYNSGMKSVKIDKLASSVDVLPTILNMFGYAYDSRLLMGTDIMSNHNSLVIFSDNSWISERGRYNATTGKFYPSNGENVEDEYISSINNEVQNRVIASENIIVSNYYEKILATLSKSE